jgi:hypothetical protein
MPPEGLLRWLRGLPFLAKVGLYTVLVASAFVLAVAVGSLAAVAVGGDLVLPGSHAPRPPDGSGKETTTLQSTEPRDKGAPDSQYESSEGQGNTGGDLPWTELEGCEQSQGDCARAFGAKVVPKAKYVGGRTDTDGSGRTHHVLYFVDPAKEPCEYEKFESPSDGSDDSYDVLIAGEGSSVERQLEDNGKGCLPKL